MGISTTSSRRLRVGVSSCLLGRNVRYDGGHKKMPYLTGVLADQFEWVPVCPEVEIGLGTPREPIDLVAAEGEIRLVARSGNDLTDVMRSYAARRVAELAGDELSGYVLKSKSPSCGLNDVPVHTGNGEPGRSGRGLFAEELVRAFPNLPIEDERALETPSTRDNFIERVLAYGRLRDLLTTRWQLRDLIAFHTAHKLMLMAHSPELTKSIGKLLATGNDLPRARLAAEYERKFMSCLQRPASAKGHTNVLHHIVGYFDERLDARDRRVLLDKIEDYRIGRIPLVEPLGLVRHFVTELDVVYLKGQLYAFPEQPS